MRILKSQCHFFSAYFWSKNHLWGGGGGGGNTSNKRLFFMCIQSNKDMKTFLLLPRLVLTEDLLLFWRTPALFSYLPEISVTLPNCCLIIGATFACPFQWEGTDVMISMKMKGNRYKQDNFHLPVETSIDGTQDGKSQPCCLSVRCKTEFMNATKTTLVAKWAALPTLPHVSTTLLA